MKIDYKKTFTSYWEYLALKTACKTELFDFINEGHNTYKKLAEKGNFNLKVLTDLLNALENSGTIKILHSKIILTKEGEIFTENHHETLKYACIHWGEEHMTAWQNLEYTLKTGNSAFENIFKKPLFDYLSEDKKRLEFYHKAMNEYARDDYKNICQFIDFSKYKSIIDIGGGLGALISEIADEHKNTKCYLLDKKEVLEFVKHKNITKIAGDFFVEIPEIAEVVILSRVIHDWNIDKANLILKNVYKALPKNGILFLIENLTDRIKNKATLLSLNMHLITKSYERSEQEYTNLLKRNGFKVEEVVKINDLQYAIKSRKI